MNPEQFAQFLRSNEEATSKAIEKFVNGKVDKFGGELMKHAEKDEQFQLRAEPMLRVFEENRVARAVIEKDTKKITFYIREATTIGVFLAGLWAIVKFLIGK